MANILSLASIPVTLLIFKMTHLYATKESMYKCYHYEHKAQQNLSFWIFFFVTDFLINKIVNILKRILNILNTLNLEINLNSTKIYLDASNVDLLNKL